ncbi:Uncharacterised protein [Mycobacteroides abscessus subsp. abscessus]|uniref:Uncharacterized protein n=4 Tax=Mycobacteriaceae TaxID=1762 RepID=A0A0H5RY29_9MYCO|nr:MULTISPECIES: hypothetical protein [Mycobacteriaceae]NOP95097.1 hypothetical protein [Mycolicibacterium fortuitum]EIC71217.1 hypothetical protein S7W_00330 [Mycobacteroides abscessus M94]MBE5449623.1 hypothetical protein [Mycobacteroides abscessus]MBE5463953.1 hypothetical protein [Mycobacteroides abscessus]MBN7365642.1 hypothetical protein [Mycobacteroides abscessus subsp. abscessus]
MTEMPRRTALAVLGAAGTVAALAYLLRTTIRMPAGRAEGPGMMGGISGTDMSRYMAMFARHNELRRTVEDIPGGIRTVTESGAPDLVAQLHAHVSSMYDHLGQGAEVTCMSDSLPTLFRRASDYQRQITLTSNGVAVIETATDPALIDAIRAHAREVTGFVVNGMPTMMGPMMGR